MKEARFRDAFFRRQLCRAHPMGWIFRGDHANGVCPMNMTRAVGRHSRRLVAHNPVILTITDAAVVQKTCR